MFDDFFSLDGAYSKAMNWIWNVLMLSIFWFLCCIPIITIGASSTAAYYSAAKVIRHNNGRIIPEFFSSFRQNLKQCIWLTLIMGFVLIALFADCLYLYAEPAVPVGMLYLFYFLFLAADGCMIHLWAFVSRFSHSVFSFLRASIVLAFRHIFSTVLLLVIQAVVLLGIYLMPWGILLFPGIGFYISTFISEQILRKYAPVVSEDDPEAQKWYYQ